MSKKMTWSEAIEKVLREYGGAMHYTEIADKIMEEDLVKTKGATPSSTINAELHGKIRNKVQRVGRGLYVWTGERPTEEIQTVGSSLLTEEDTEEEQYDVITSFGMYWRRNAVKWDGNPKLYGVQSAGTKVDLGGQIGLYLLYDGREVIYAGMTDKRRLGRRLGDHTRDRLATRWDRFSWFGMLPVSDKGELGSLPESYSPTKILSAFEAILIEALEPRQNRRQGNGLTAVDFSQEEDPSVLTDTMMKLIAKFKP